jgi:two-component system, NarL family, sensor histidine kinase UhpB
MKWLRLSVGAAAWQDLAGIVIATGLFAVLSVHFELGERVSAWSRPLERYQLDELPGLLMFMALGLAWFGWRRTREARAELRRRRAIEAELTAALQANRQLERANARIQEDERKTLARELHDELGQYLNAIKVDAVCLRGADPLSVDDVQRSAASIIAIVDRVQGTVGDMVRRLRPPGLDELGLPAAIEHCIDSWRRPLSSVRFEFDVADGLKDMGETVNMTLYRLVQEGLTNVAKHAQAHRVSIRLEQLEPAANQAASVTLQLSDDGVGLAASTPASGMGLVGMRERVEALGGSFEAANVTPRGFRIVATLPLPEAHA